LDFGSRLIVGVHAFACVQLRCIEFAAISFNPEPEEALEKGFGSEFGIG
jgi:hypothetical protein